MNRSFFIIGLLSVLIAATRIHAGYSDLKKELESYTPPSYLQSHVSRSQIQAQPESEDEFAGEKQRLETIKSRWVQSLSTRETENAFYKPDEKRLTQLQPAASDVNETAKTLKKSFSLEALEILTLLRNPGIKAAENRFRAAVESFSQVSGIDEILRRYTAFTEGVMVGVGPKKGKDPVAMKFPFPGVLALKGQVVNQEVAAARESLEVSRRNAVTAARKAYWNLLFIRKAQQITREMIDLLNHLEAVGTIRYEAGKTSFQDVIKVRIKRETIEENLVTLRETQRNLEAKVREILNLPRKTEIGKPARRRPSMKKLSLQSLGALALERNQELRRLRARIGKMQRMIELAETMILPPYTLNLSLYEDEAIRKVGSSAVKPAFPEHVEASRGAGLPKMPWYGADDAYLRQTRQKLGAMRNQLAGAEAETINRVRSGWFDLDRAQREVVLYRDKVVNLSQAALDTSSRGYEAGKVSFADVIESYTTWLNANLALEQRFADTGVARVALERILGRSLN